ncbi:hypothetical protein SR882_05260 [Guyparkeria halophila]|uniref:YtxH domain-containing protein n=1 Tax=Guyparkeria halophila TaxID=47960 RepID=A0ABZ0Z1R9_9GAMM|nr:hypothetical protein [Guyparkeria halophila]WQH17315.1 hypothetical protein SR882_05260 [Guyparkeria halophila]
MNARNALIALMMALGLTVAGCSEEQGPAEKAGEQIDQTMEEAGDEVEEATDEMGGKAEEAGDKMEEETDY